MKHSAGPEDPERERKARGGQAPNTAFHAGSAPHMLTHAQECPPLQG